jgi:hypothetical protein
MIIDDMENSTERAYDAWPDRIYLIGTDGRVAWKSGHGPWGFRPNELERALRDLLGRRERDRDR